MKIDDRVINYSINQNQPKSVPDEHNKVDGKQPIEGAKTGSKDALEQVMVVQFSKASKEAQLINDVISSEPDVRQDKVADLKAKIESGEYRINHRSVADKLVSDAIDELF